MANLHVRNYFVAVVVGGIVVLSASACYKELRLRKLIKLFRDELPAYAMPRQEYSKR